MTASCVLGCGRPLTDDDRVPCGFGASHGTCAVLLAMRLRAAHVALGIRACDRRSALAAAVVVEEGPAACPCGGKLDGDSGLCECGAGRCVHCQRWSSTAAQTPDGLACLTCEESLEQIADAEVRS